MAFLIYDAKVAVALLVFYLFYRFLLKKETFHRFNRVVLVGTAVLSFLLPLCIITIHKPMEMAAPLVTESAMVAERPEQELAPQVQASEPWWPVVLTILFWTGVACVLARVLVSILSILRIIRQAKPVREEDGCRIFVTERNIDPFSWMKYIVLSRKDWELPHESILTHEKAHIAYGHSIEILLADILSALQWFNPAIWMLRADLKELHEYEADDAVLRAGANLREYQYLLIRKAVSKSGYSVANSFNHSILKNRITMMSKSKSPLARGLRVLWLLPLVCLAIGLQARTVYVPVDKDSEKNFSEETSALSGTVWTGDVGKLTFSDTAFEIRMEEALVSGRYTSEGATIRFIFTNYRNLKTGKEKKGEDELTGTREGDAITIPAPHGEMVFSRVSQRAVQKAGSIVLNIRKDGTVESGGKVYTPAQLKDLIAPHQAGQPQTTVMIMAPDDAPMGVIDDVKNELRKLESLKVNYASASSREGVTRYMPPYPSVPTAKKPNYPEETFPGVKRENIFVVRINANDKIFFGDRPRQDDQEMLQAGKDFLRKRGKDARFSLQADRGTSYGAYQHMQSLLWQVYEEVRNEKALEVYGKRLPDLSADERSQINFLVPLSISEAEMKGKK